MNFGSYFSELCDFIKEHGIEQGDVVYLGTDVSPILFGALKEYGLNDRENQLDFLSQIIDCIQSVVGKEGTVLVPMFTWAFCRGVTFDYNKTKGEIGFFPNFVFMYRKDFKRTKHPMYGFLVWGKDADFLTSLDNQDSFSLSSPFGYLYEKNAKQINLGVPLDRAITIMHYVEQMAEVPYRYKKTFMGKYVDENGMEEIRTYSMNVRDLAIESHASLPEDFFVSLGVADVAYFHEYKITFISLAQICDVMRLDISENGARNLYTFKDYAFDVNSKKTHQDEVKIMSGDIIAIPEI